MIDKRSILHEYQVSGEFYIESGFKCRKFLDIKHNDSKATKPDLMVVMMNPGSSKPLDGDENKQKASPTMPDDTQGQIVELMRRASFTYTRVLNLSDYRTPSSSILYHFIESEQSTTFHHSIFSPERSHELKELFVLGVPVVYAWGVDPRLEGLANMAMKSINHPSPIGILKTGTKSGYYHPLPHGRARQKQWLYEISNALSQAVSINKSFRFFYANATRNTWPKLFVLSSDGVLYCEYLDHRKQVIFREQHDFLTFDPNSFKWQGYQSIVECDKKTALSFKLISQKNWIEKYTNTIQLPQW